MYNEEINKMIMTSMKSGEKEKAAVYRLLKSEFLKFSTAKDAKILDDSAEIQIIRKMVKERKESEKVYADAGRNDLAENEKNEYLILEDFLQHQKMKKSKLLLSLHTLKALNKS